MIKLFVYFSIIFFSGPLLAASLGGFSESLLRPTAVATLIVTYACYIIGAGFCFMAVAQYRVHRQSPKLIPLGTPFMLLIFGLLLIFLPYFSTLFQSGSALEQAKKSGMMETGHQGLALPTLERTKRKRPGDFIPSANEKKQAPTQNATPTQPAAPPPAVPNPEKKSHWSDDSKYQ